MIIFTENFLKTNLTPKIGRFKLFPLLKFLKFELVGGELTLYTSHFNKEGYRMPKGNLLEDVFQYELKSACKAECDKKKVQLHPQIIEEGIYKFVVRKIEPNDKNIFIIM